MAVQIDVIDQGYGIRAKEADRVFAPFQRARQPQIIGEFGYGLSLYLAKAEVEAMGGRIWYESEEGVGSTFSVKLPTWKELSEDDV
jgi:signal transduction histidine kinase